MGANDWYRLERALEVALIREGPPQSKAAVEAPSEVEAEAGAEAEAGLEEGVEAGAEVEAGRAAVNYDLRCFFLCPTDRRRLCEHIDEVRRWLCWQWARGGESRLGLVLPV